MNLRGVFAALLGHWRRAPLQLISLILGLAVATALWSGVQAINAEARVSYDRAAKFLGQNTLARVVPVGGGDMDQSSFVALRRAGWKVSPVLEGALDVPQGRVRIVGVDPLSAPAGAAPGDVRNPQVLQQFFTGLGFAAPQTLAQFAGAGVLPPLQPMSGAPSGVVMVDIGVAQRLLGKPGKLSHLLVLPGQRAALPSISDIAPDLRQQAVSTQTDLARLTDSFHLNLTAFGLLSFAVGLFIVHGTISLAFEQRRAMFRTLRAIGVPLRGLMVLLLAEVLVFALIAGAIGTALGYVIAAALLPDVAATLGGLYGADVPGTLSLRPAWWLGGMAVAVLGAGAASAQSLWQLSRLPLLATAQPRAWARASRGGLAVQLLVACGLFAAALMLMFWGTGLVAGFAMLGALLMGGALVLPVILVGVLGLGARLARSVRAEWFWADTRQQVPGLSLALMALMLALAANIGVSTMVGSFRQTFTGYLDQRLAAELYITARTNTEAGEITDFLSPQVQAVLPIWQADSTLDGTEVAVYGFRDHDTYRDHWPLLERLPDVWAQVGAGTHLLINEQLFRRQNIALGQEVTLGGKQTYRVAGVYSDYGNPRGQIMLSLGQFQRHFPNSERRRMGVRADPAAIAGIMGALSDRFDLPPRNMRDQATMKRFSMAVFERTFAVTGALNVLTLSVAALAILTSLLTLAGMRMPQLAPVWALGQTRAQLAWLELIRALCLALLTLVVALPFGVLLAWTLLAKVNVVAFGWRLPMYLFPADWALLGMMALLAAGLAAAWPALRLMRIAPAELLKVFANER